MKTSTLLQAVAVALFAVGVLALGLDASSLEGVGLDAEDAFAAGIIFTSVGLVMFADVRRRARRNSGSA